MQIATVKSRVIRRVAHVAVKSTAAIRCNARSGSIVSFALLTELQRTQQLGVIFEHT